MVLKSLQNITSHRALAKIAPSVDTGPKDRCFKHFKDRRGTKQAFHYAIRLHLQQTVVKSHFFDSQRQIQGTGDKNILNIEPILVTAPNCSDPPLDVKNAHCIRCSTTLEGALITLLLDGQNHPSNSHLRLHRKLAPYKMSFALDYKDIDNKETMNELAILLYNILEGDKISTWLPDFALPKESQIKENLLMGVAYTAVISEGTLSNGILHLLNSNTTLKEQIHVADLSSYAALLFQK